MNRAINLSEKSLKTDIRDISREIAHELFLICRKAGIYSVDHPMVVKGIAKPFMGMQKIFSYKQYFNLYFVEGRLYANNIQITDAGAVNFLKDHMHELEVDSILFSADMTTDDLISFVSRIVSKRSPDHKDYSLQSFLVNRKISTILINDPLAEKLYNAGLRYREGQCEEYSVRRMVSDYFSGDVDLAIKALTSQYADTEAQAEQIGIDYYTEIVSFLLPEKFAQLPPSELFNMACQIIEESEPINDDSILQLNRLIRSLDFHPKRIELVSKIEDYLKDKNIDIRVIGKSLNDSSSIKKDTLQDIDRIVAKFFSTATEEPLFDSFHDNYMRLIRTRQMGKAASISDFVVSHLTSENALYRQYALILLKDITKSGVAVGEVTFIDVILKQLKSLFTRGLETFEFSEIAVFLLRIAIANRRYEVTAVFLGIIRAGRKQEGSITVYDSISIRRIFDDLNDRELISFLIREIHSGDGTAIKATREILMAIQSEEVAIQLANIVAHPNRQVRQHCLKILSALGKPAVTIFSEIVRDEDNFYRDPERRELPDEKWYLIRNAIFVLGNLKDVEACHALRLRLSDSDTRVRMEIVRAVEKIGGDDGVDLLMILAEDRDEPIREAAIIALGLFKQPELLPFFTDLLYRQKGEITRIINAIALTGIPEAYSYLESVMGNKEKMKELTSGKASVSYIKKMIVSALEKFGDDTTKKRAEELQSGQENNLTKTAKLLLGKFKTD